MSTPRLLGIVATGRAAPLQFMPDGAIIIWTASSGIGGSQTANQWGANYEGTLSLPGETYEVSGSLDGIFLGNRTSSPLPKDIVKRQSPIFNGARP
ncbi:hypothetical protein [Octadecabacter antarcticus]|uniref:hypothetical protein n=1 Tax=Octadecabacter antarcticus TaxID=1217908 RepID=UPI000685E79E|nr:hypothetical protein [Octadecabacter antarcticus]